MTYEEHKARHVMLHGMLDELLADYFIHNRSKLPSNSTLLELIKWSHQQTLDPTPHEDSPCSSTH